MNIIAILPIKYHSERIPQKNTRLFNDYPLFYYIIDTLQSSNLIRSIIIDTDSSHIEKEANRVFSKVRIIIRPEHLQGDHVSMNEIIAYDISQIDGEHFLQTHCTNPLLTISTLDHAIHEYFHSLEDYDSLFSVTPFQSRFYFESGKPINHDPSELLRTQDLAPLYEENSNFYIFSKQSFQTAGNNRIGNKPKMFPMNPLEAIDIDEEEDFQLAQCVQHLQKIGKI